LLLTVIMVLLTQVKISVPIEEVDVGSFSWKAQEAKPLEFEIVKHPKYIDTEIQDHKIVLKDDEWEVELSIKSSIACRKRANVTYYEEGKPHHWRIELLVKGFFIEFDINYLNKTTSEMTHVRKFLISEYVEGFDLGDYVAAARNVEEITPTVSDYSIGKIHIINRRTSVIDRRFNYIPPRDEYEEEVDVEIIFDVRCFTRAETQITLIDYLSEKTGGIYNAIVSILGTISAAFGIFEVILRVSRRGKTYR